MRAMELARLVTARIGAFLMAKAGALPQGWVEISRQSVGPDGTSIVKASPTSLLEEYSRSIWVHSCVSTKARFAAGIPFKVMRERDGGEDEEVEDHPITKLLYNPAPDMTWDHLCAALVSHLELAGRAFVEIVRDKYGPAQLYPLLPNHVEVKVDPKEGVKEFVYTPNASPIALQRKDVLWVRYFDPLDPYGGVGGMLPGWVSNMLDRHGREWNAAFFKRSATPDVLLMTDKPIPPDERKRMAEEWLGRHKGTEKGRGVSVLPYGMKVEPFTASHREIQFERLMKMSREEIHAVFKVPPVLSGLTDQVNYANSQSQIAVFTKYVVLPMMKSILAVFDAVLAEYPGGEGLYLAADEKALTLPEEAAAQASDVRMDFELGIITRDEARAKRGYAPAPEGAFPEGAAVAEADALVAAGEEEEIRDAEVVSRDPRAALPAASGSEALAAAKAAARRMRKGRYVVVRLGPGSRRPRRARLDGEAG